MQTHIQVFGAGCTPCNKLAETVVALAEKLRLDYTFEKVSDLSRIIEAGIISTPALAIDGEIQFSGRVPRDEEIEAILSKKR